MADTCATIEPAGWLPGSASRAEERALRPILIQTIHLARQGRWIEAEELLHGALTAIAPETLPQVYIACVDLVPALLADPFLHEAAFVDPARPSWSVSDTPRPRPFPGAGPALNYAHAIVTALRLRLTTPESKDVRQAS
jgi:hypothetical protein